MLQATNQMNIATKVTSGVVTMPTQTYIVRQSHVIPDPLASVEPDMSEFTEEGRESQVQT